MSILDIVIYVAAFLAVYMQVFLFITFIQKKGLLKSDLKNMDIGSLPAITFLVPCWNEQFTLANTIESLRKINYPQDKFFMIVVDDGSVDGTWQEMQKYKDDAQIQILTQKNSGKHEALNNALRYAKTELVASIDADTVIKSDALMEAVSYFLKDKELSSVGCSVLIKTPKTFIQKAQSIEYQMYSFSKKMLSFLGGVLVVPGAFSIFKTKILSDIGGWHAGNGLEDLELTYRMQVSGYKVAHCHSAIAYTSGPKSLRSLFKQRLRWGYGFLKNTSEYKYAMFNRKLGNFGFYTLPTALLSYVVILTVFSISWYRIFNFFYEKIMIYRLVGFNAMFGDFSFSWFFVNTKAIVFITIVIIVLYVFYFVCYFFVIFYAIAVR